MDCCGILLLQYYYSHTEFYFKFEHNIKYRSEIEAELNNDHPLQPDVGVKVFTGTSGVQSD